MILSEYKKQIAPDTALMTATKNLFMGVTDDTRRQDYEIRKNFNLQELIQLFEMFKNPLYKVRFTISGGKLEEIKGEEFYEVKLFAPQS